MFGELADLHGDKGVWRLLDRRADEVVEVPIAGPIPLDVDTEARTTQAVLAGRRRARRMSPREVTGEAADEVRVLVPDVETLARRLADVDYLVDEGLATSMFLSVRLPQPLLLEGEAGVGKTEAAKALARRARHAADPPAVLRGDRRRRGAVRVELPAPAAQHPARRLAAARTLGEEELFGPDYLIRRPLLRALEHPGPRPAVLLIDEIDRADDDFEAFLLELLAEASVTIPEIGTIARDAPADHRADLQPHARPARRGQAPLPVPLDRLPEPAARGRDRPPPGARAPRRRWRCRSRTPSRACASSDVQKPPGIAEAIDWLAALSLLGVERLDAAAVDRTLGSVLKYGEDQEVIRAAGLEELVGSGD